MLVVGIVCGWPANLAQTIIGTNHQYKFTESEALFCDTSIYRQFGGVHLVRIQRWFGHERLEFLKKFLKPLSEQLGFTIAYEIDDVLVYDDIPNYNIAKAAFNPENIGDSVREIMSLCDIITVSTDYLRDFYIKRLNLPKEKFIVINNYLPRWWIGDSFNLTRQMNQYNEHKRSKPVIGFCCSSNHFDLKNLNGGVDDFTHIIPWILKNINKYNFVFVGGIPLQLKEHLDKRISDNATTVRYF
jgi:hypothetical protein